MIGWAIAYGVVAALYWIYDEAIPGVLEIKGRAIPPVRMALETSAACSALLWPISLSSLLLALALYGGKYGTPK